MTRTEGVTPDIRETRNGRAARGLMMMTNEAKSIIGIITGMANTRKGDTQVIQVVEVGANPIAKERMKGKRMSAKKKQRRTYLRSKKRL